jgi:hypothetical protein
MTATTPPWRGGRGQASSDGSLNQRRFLSSQTLPPFASSSVAKGLADAFKGSQTTSQSIGTNAPNIQRPPNIYYYCISCRGVRRFHDSQTGILLGIPRSARCVQRFDDSLNSAIHITYRISLRSSSMREPRDPLLKVVFNISSISNIQKHARAYEKKVHVGRSLDLQKVHKGV